jgi:signal peptidase I
LDTAWDVLRIVGFGGDKILIKDKKIYINDKLYFDPYGIYKSPTIISGNKKPRDTSGPVVVKKDSLFVMGDNRDRSYDSRFFGFINENQIKGKVLYVY